MTKIPCMTSWPAVVSLLLLLTLAPSPAQATIIPLQVTLDGIQEVGSGDLDGLASGIINFDDITGLVSWNISYSNIDTPLAMHIHGPSGVAGVNAGVFVGLGVNTTGGINTLIDSLTIDITKINLITNNPTDFYINLHTQAFPAGAVRGQLSHIAVPLPGTLPLLLIGGLLMVLRRLTNNGNTKKMGRG